jgi:uncharacterized protein (UPF0335 family)
MIRTQPKPVEPQKPSADQLRSIVERIERLREEIAALNADVSEVYKEAKGNGFDVPTIKALVSERAKAEKDPDKFNEANMLLDLYREQMEVGTRNATRVHAHETKSDTRSALTGVAAVACAPSTEAAEGGDAEPHPVSSPVISAPVPVTIPPVAGVEKAGDTRSPVSPARNSDPSEDEFHCPTCGDGDLPRGVTICPTCDAMWPDEEEESKPIPEASPTPAPNSAFQTEDEALEIPGFLRRKREASHA